MKIDNEVSHKWWQEGGQRLKNLEKGGKRVLLACNVFQGVITSESAAELLIITQ